MSIDSLEGVKPGDLYTTNGEDVWEVTALCQSPTIELRNLRTNAERGGAVGCLLLGSFVKIEMPKVEGA